MSMSVWPGRQVLAQDAGGAFFWLAEFFAAKSDSSA